MSPVSDEISKKIEKILNKDASEVELAILFGSFAQGRQGPKSDIDIAVASDHILTDERRVDLQLVLSKELGREVDLVDLQSSGPVVLHECLTRGQLIFKKNPSLFARLMRRLWYLEADWMPARRRIEAGRRRRAFGA